MAGIALGAGLTPRFPAPPVAGSGPFDLMTEEAAITAPGADLRVEVLAAEGDLVAQGAPVARLRHHPEVCLVAPMAARIGAVRLGPGHRLSEIVLFREAGGDRARYMGRGDARSAMQAAGLWPAILRRPFGGMPAPHERPAAIFVTAADTRPGAPDPRAALVGHEEAFGRGLSALETLTEGPVYVCHARGLPPSDLARAGGRIRTLPCGPRHPQGLAGLHVHAVHPARLDAAVWDLDAQDVAALGAVLGTGLMPETRLVRVSGGALRESRLVRTQPGADLRGLTLGALRPGSHVHLAGDPLSGRAAHWLGPRDRQVTVIPHAPRKAQRHWFLEALTGSARAKPVIPTAALSHAFAASLPAAALVRAILAGDDETAMRLGVLSFLEEDMALADYVLGGAHLAGALRQMLTRIETELAP